MPDDETKTLLAAIWQRLETQPAPAPQPAAQPAAATIDLDQLAAKIAAAVKPAPVSSGRPISDYGAPVGNAPIVSWRTSLSSNPIGMSKAERRAHDMEVGADVARRQRLAAGQIQAEGIRVIPPRRTEQSVGTVTTIDTETGK